MTRPYTVFKAPVVKGPLQGTDEFIEKPIHGSSIKYYETADGLLSAQFEHTVLVNEQGHEILTNF